MGIFFVRSADGGGGGTIIDSLDYSIAATSSNNGWTPRSVDHGVKWTQSRVAGGGPQGQDCYEIDQIPDTSGSPPYGGDFSYGHGKTITPHLNGASRFYRWRMRYASTCDFNALDISTGASEQVVVNKFLIVGDSSILNSRFIVQGDAQPTIGWLLSIQIDGGVPTPTPRYALDVWKDVQIELIYSSALDVADGGFKIWMDENTYASPTASRTGIVMNRPASGSLSWGYMNRGLASGAVHTWRHADFTIATAFHGTWNS